MRALPPTPFESGTSAPAEDLADSARALLGPQTAGIGIGPGARRRLVRSTDQHVGADGAQHRKYDGSQDHQQAADAAAQWPDLGVADSHVVNYPHTATRTQYRLEPCAKVEALVSVKGMMRRPILFLTIGLPCTGKTTAARRIETEHRALRLTKDEWVKALYGPDNPRPAGDVIEGRLIQIALRALELGTNVVIDYGLWSRDERSALRQAAADRDARVEMRYFELSPAEQRRRADRRQAEAPHTTWPMSDSELAEWAAAFEIPTRGELDGTEPIDDPPAGFATWDEWREHRWPQSVF